jgi:hypothetical protein
MLATSASSKSVLTLTEFVCMLPKGIDSISRTSTTVVGDEAECG